MTDAQTHRQRILAFVAGHDGFSAYEISRSLGLDPASASACMQKMVKQGVLRRTPGGGPKGGFTYHAVRKL